MRNSILLIVGISIILLGIIAILDNQYIGFANFIIGGCFIIDSAYN